MTLKADTSTGKRSHIAGANLIGAPSVKGSLVTAIKSTNICKCWHSESLLQIYPTNTIQSCKIIHMYYYSLWLSLMNKQRTKITQMFINRELIKYILVHQTPKYSEPVNQNRKVYMYWMQNEISKIHSKVRNKLQAVKKCGKKGLKQYTPTYFFLLDEYRENW